MLILETSWEVCNKMGGIYTVLSSRANVMMSEHDGRVVFIGPLLGTDLPKDFISEKPSLLKGVDKFLESLSLDYLIGSWDVPGRPAVILVDYKPLFANKDSYYFEIWKAFGLQSDKGYGDYDDSSLFSVAAASVMQAVMEKFGDENNVITIFNEWQTGMGLLYTKLHNPRAKTMFITHATTIGRSISGNNKELYRYMSEYNGDIMAKELNVEAKHSVEKLAAHNADIFGTVSELTKGECTQLLERTPYVLPNGFESDMVPKAAKYNKVRIKARQKLSQVVQSLTGSTVGDNDLFVVISGRYEYRNKGIDLFVESMSRLNAMLKGDNQVFAFVTVPAWVAEPRADLQLAMDKGLTMELQHPNITHWLHNMNYDRLLSHLRHLNLSNAVDDRVKVIFAPCYLNGDDGIFNLKYYDLLPGFDISLFPSYYEPWGYTPHESIAFGVPTITSNFAGFGLWAKPIMQGHKNPAVTVIEREDGMFDRSAEEIATIIAEYMNKSTEEKELYRGEAKILARKADWGRFYKYYLEAYKQIV